MILHQFLHADHRFAGQALAAEAGVEYVLHTSAKVGFAARDVVVGDRLPLGNVVVDVLHTPGHTPEHICLLVTDRTRGDDPWFVLTGHTLMVGDVGRTELAGDAACGALTLFGSLQRLKSLPDHVEVLPGAFAGSVCGHALSGKPASTIGFERRHNAAFGIAEAERFIALMLENVPPTPPQAAEMRSWNAGRPPRVSA